MARTSEARALCALVLLLLPACAAGQTGRDWTAGVEYSFGVPLHLERRDGRVSWCDCDPKGYSSNHEASLTGDVRWPWLFAEGAGLTLRGALGFSSGLFTSDQYTTSPFFDPRSSRVVTALARFEARSDAPFARLEALASIALTEYVTLDAGPWISQRFDGRTSLTEFLLAPSNAAFPESGTTTRVLRSDDALAGARTHGGIALAFRFASPLSGTTSIAWNIHSRADAAALGLGLGIRAFSIGAGLSISLHGESEDTEPEPLEPAPVVVDTAAPLARAARPLEATIRLFSVGGNGERISRAMVRTAQQYYRQSAPLIPFVFFDKNSAQIPGRYAQISRANRFSFSTRRLIRLHAAEQYYQILNVIGLRLTENPAASLTIVGSASPDEPAAMAEARAEAVQYYLRTIWDLPASRVKIETRVNRPARYTNPAQLRCVEFRSASRAAFAPLTTDWMVENFVTTPINLDPTIRNAEALRDWSITIMHKDKEIARYSSDDAAAQRDLDVGLLFGGGANSDLPPLYARFDVTDTTGTIITATDALGFAFAGDSTGGREVDVRSTSTYVIRSADLGASSEGRSTRELLRDIAARLNNGDRIVVRPVLDVGGAAFVTAERARQDVQHVATGLLIELGKKDVAISTDRGAPVTARERELPEFEILSSLIAITLERNLGTAVASPR